MKSYKTFLVLNLLVAVALSSCSGLPRSGTGGCLVNCAGGGNAVLNMTVTATPSTKFSVLRLVADVTGLAVTNSAGKVIQEIGVSTTAISDGYRLQTESQFISKASITGDNYTSVTITFGLAGVSGIFINTSASTVLGCAFGSGACPAGSVSCPAPPAGGQSLCVFPAVAAPFSVVVPATFTVIAGQNMGLDVNLNLDIAITAQKIDFTLPGAIGISLLPRKGQAAGSLDSLEDYTGGVVSTSSGTIVTVTASPVQEQRDFTTTTGTTTFTDPLTPSTCTTANFACLAFNQTVSVDALIKSDGITFPATDVDFLDKANTHQAEGIVINTNTGTPGQFQMMVLNFLGGQLSATNFINPGSVVTISIQPGATFGIDTKNLVVSSGFASETDLFVGQVVMARALSQTGNFPNITVTSDRVVLRYSHFNGTVNTISPPTFTLTLASVPAYLGLTGANPIVGTNAGVTTFDGVTDINGLQIGDKVSIRALYLNPNSVSPFFVAAKVRKNF